MYRLRGTQPRLSESAETRERLADIEESTGERERPAEMSESAEDTERPAVPPESTIVGERPAEPRECAKELERPAVGEERAVIAERSAVIPESTEGVERSADEAESIGLPELAEDGGQLPGADPGASSSADTPRYKLGYPRIESPSHHLWVDQQTDWPHHLPHEAWQALVRTYNREPSPKGDSASHPAFAQDYAPNYAATQELSRDYVDARHGAKSRR